MVRQRAFLSELSEIPPVRINVQEKNTVKLYEYQAKRIFRQHGIPVPEGIPCTREEDVTEHFRRIGNGRGVVLKSQVLVGGRGKAGGVKIARSTPEAVDLFHQILGMTIKGHQVSRVLMEKAVPIRREYYLGITIDPTSSRPVLLMSSQGGMDVESIAKDHPSALGQLLIDHRYGVPSHGVLDLVSSLGLPPSLSFRLVDLAKRLYAVFWDHDGTLTEINPLVETDAGDVMAVDARLNVDNNALYKHPDLLELRKEFADSQEIRLKEHGVEFVYLGGNVGLICAGAGMTMATMDLIHAMGGKAACFCDVSGGVNPTSMEMALRVVSSLEGVRVLLVNMFGGVTRMDEVAHSFIEGWEHIGDLSLQTVIRLEGTNAEEGRNTMREHGFEMFTNLYDAVRQAVDWGTG